MKILMLGWELPPHNSGGLGVACYQLCQALSSHNDIDIEFVLPYRTDHKPGFMKLTSASPVALRDPEYGQIFAYDSVDYSYSDGTVLHYDIHGQQRLYEDAVERLADETEFDLVHAHDWLTFRAALRLKARFGCPIIVHAHSIESDRAGGKSGNPLVHEIEYMGFQMADHILAVSDFTRRAIARDYHIPLERIEVVHNSIAAETFEPLQAGNVYTYLAALKAQGYRVITNVGRLTIQKGLPNLLRAMQLVVHHHPKSMLLLVGAGEQYEELIELSAELGIAQNVIFAGFQRGQAWRDAFGIADLFVMPSVSEPFGLTPLEAAMYGTPSLISKQAGVAEVLKSCLKVDFWDVNEMANHIIGAVRSDPLLESLSEAVEIEVNRLSWQRAADQIRDAYRRHLAEKVPA